MQSSAIPMAADVDAVQLSLENIEIFYRATATLAYSSHVCSQLAKHILKKYLAYLSAVANSLPYLPGDKRLLITYLSSFKLYNDFHQFLDKKILDDIEDDVFSKGRSVSTLFNNDSEFFNFIENINEIRLTIQRSQPTALAPVLPARAPEYAHKTYVFVSLDQTLEKIIREGDECFQMENFSAALEIYLKGKNIIEAQLENQIANIDEYSVEIHQQIAKCYFAIAEALIPSNLNFARDYYQLAVDESQSLIHEDDIWIKSQLKLIILENNLSLQLKNQNFSLAMELISSAYQRTFVIAKITPAMYQSNLAQMYLISHNMIVLLREKFYYTSLIALNERLQICKEIYLITSKLPLIPMFNSCLAIQNEMRQHSTLIVLELMKAGNYNHLFLTGKLRVLQEVMQENIKLKFDVNNNFHLDYQNKTIIKAIDLIRMHLSVMDAVITCELLILMKSMLDLLPVAQRQTECNTAVRTILNEFCVKMNGSSFHSWKSAPNQFLTYIGIQGNYDFILKVLALFGAEYFSAETKSSYHQLYLNYSIKCTLLCSAEFNEQNAKHIIVAFAKHLPNITAPTVSRAEFNTVQREVAQLLLTLGHKVRSYNNKINLYNLSIDTLEKIPKEPRTLENPEVKTLDEENIILAKKYMQFAQAEFACTPRDCDIDSLHEHIVALIYELDELRHPDVAGENRWWLYALETVREKIIKLYYKRLDTLLLQLESSLISRNCFFAEQTNQRPEIKRLHDTYHRWLKPLLSAKTAFYCNQSILALRLYTEKYPEQQPELLTSIQNSLDSITNFEAEEDDNLLIASPPRVSTPRLRP